MGIGIRKAESAIGTKLCVGSLSRNPIMSLVQPFHGLHTTGRHYAIQGK